jgi:DNA gyrase/topoisomerase IV subunit A
MLSTNRKLRRAVKERDAERSALRSETDRLKKELADAAALAQQQADDLLALRQELEETRQHHDLRRASSAELSGKGGSGGSTERGTLFADVATIKGDFLFEDLSLCFSFACAAT